MSVAARLRDDLRAADWIKRIGRITRCVGLTVEAQGPDARLGEICEIFARGARTATLAEVVGLADGRVLLMPYEDLHGVEAGSEVIATGQRAHVVAGPHLLGRVIDGLGRALDGEALAGRGAIRALYPAPINPLERGSVSEVLETGIRAIDTLLTRFRQVVRSRK